MEEGDSLDDALFARVPPPRPSFQFSRVSPGEADKARRFLSLFSARFFAMSQTAPRLRAKEQGQGMHLSDEGLIVILIVGFKRLNWAKIAHIGLARQRPLTCPLATFAVAIRNGSAGSTSPV